MILEKIDTSKPTWLGLDLLSERRSERGSQGFGHTGVFGPIPGAVRLAGAEKAASTAVNKFVDLPFMNIPTPKS
eukprot:4374262-Karenia_brevis.AAC.1